MQKTAEEPKSIEISESLDIVEEIRRRCQELIGDLNSNTIEEVEAECTQANKALAEGDFNCTQEEVYQIQDALYDLSSQIARVRMEKGIELKLNGEMPKRRTPQNYQLRALIERMGMEQKEENLPTILETRRSPFESLKSFFKNIGRSEIDRIASEIVTDEMFAESVRRLIEAQGVELDEKTYQKCLVIVDRKLPVYEFLRNLNNIEPNGLIRISEDAEFDFKRASDNLQYKCHIKNGYRMSFFSIINEFGEEKKKILDMEAGCGMIDYDFVSPYMVEPTYFLEFAKFVGKEAEFMEEFIEFVMDDKKSSSRFYKGANVKRMRNSLHKAMKEYEQNAFSFFSSEKQKIAEVFTQIESTQGTKGRRQEFAEGMKAKVDPMSISAGEDRGTEEILTNSEIAQE